MTKSNKQLCWCWLVITNNIYKHNGTSKVKIKDNFFIRFEEIIIWQFHISYCNTASLKSYCLASIWTNSSRFPDFITIKRFYLSFRPFLLWFFVWVMIISVVISPLLIIQFFQIFWFLQFLTTAQSTTAKHLHIRQHPSLPIWIIPQLIKFPVACVLTELSPCHKFHSFSLNTKIRTQTIGIFY